MYCQSLGIASGSYYFGLQAPSLCVYGSTSSTNLAKYGSVRPESECSVCATNINQINGPQCGGIQ